MRHIRLPAALAVACVLLPAAAQGQEAKRPSPDSPAGVEYQLPLEQARKNAAGEGPGDSGASARRRGKARPAPLFGAGIAAAKANERSGDAEDGGAAGSGRGDGGSDGTSGGDRDRAESTAVGAATLEDALSSGDGDDGSATLRIVGIALAVLLVGALLGLFLRRGLRQSEA